MSYEIYTIKPGEYERIAKINHVTQINWDDDIDRIYLTFSFTTSTKLEVGTWIELYHKYDQKTVFRGIITKTSQKDEFTYTYSGYDLGFYCEKNKVTIQYKEPTQINKAISEVLNLVEIPYGDIIKNTQTVKKIYKNVLVSEILKDLLELGRNKGLKNTYYDCKNGKVNLYKYSENDNLKGYVANLYSLKTTDTIHEYDITSSIEEMKNRIQVITSETKKGTITRLSKEYTLSDTNSINKYGILQETIEPQKDEKNYKKLAEDKLQELNKVTNEISLTGIGDYNTQMGVIIPITKEKLNLNDKYLIKTSYHTIQGTKETVEINIRAFKEEYL